MADGKGCKCAAYSESECACDADWTPQEVYDLRAENARLKEAIRRIAEQDATLSVQGGNVTVTMDAPLTDEEREAIERAILELDEIRKEFIPTPVEMRLTRDFSTLRGLLERTR